MGTYGTNLMEQWWQQNCADPYAGWDAVWEIVLPEGVTEYSFFGNTWTTGRLKMDWGDGTVEELHPYNGSGYVIPVTHTYSSSGTYICKAASLYRGDNAWTAMYLGEPYSWKSGSVGDSILRPTKLLKLNKAIVARYSSGYTYFARGCANLQSVILSSDMEILGASFFYGCASLQTVEMSNVATLGDMCFADCFSLGSLVLPSTLTSVAMTFRQSYYSGKRPSGAYTITFTSTPTTLDKNAFVFGDLITDIYVPWSSTDAINANAPWGATNATIHYNHTA